MSTTLAWKQCHPLFLYYDFYLLITNKNSSFPPLASSSSCGNYKDSGLSFQILLLSILKIQRVSEIHHTCFLDSWAIFFLLQIMIHWLGCIKILFNGVAGRNVLSCPDSVWFVSKAHSTTSVPNWLSAGEICGRYLNWKLSCTLGFLKGCVTFDWLLKLSGVESVVNMLVQYSFVPLTDWGNLKKNLGHELLVVL